jgi:probable F420-dependent oxidoreductase
MKFSYHSTMCNPAFYKDLAIAAEAAGYDTFTLPDSICYPQHADSRYPYNADGSREFLDGVPFLEPFSLVPWMAAVTTRLKFSTSVMKLPIRQPTLVAKSLTSVAVLTDNRFIFGVGVSPWREDFDACGERWDGRGKRMDEMIHIIRGLSSGDYFGFKGEFYDLPAIKLCPVPTQPVPILIGGHAEPALRRAAQLGDGWISAGGNLAEQAAMIKTINRYREECGRAHLPFDIQSMGPEGYTVDGVKRLEDQGVQEVVIAFRDAYAGGEDKRTLAEMIGELNGYADRVIAKVRG